MDKMKEQWQKVKESFKSKNSLSIFLFLLGLGFGLLAYFVFEWKILSCVLIVVFFLVLSGILFFYNQRKAKKDPKMLHQQIETICFEEFVNNLSMYLIQGNEKQQAFDLAINDIKDKDFKDHLECFIKDKTGPLHASNFKGLLDFILLHFSTMDTQEFLSYCHSNLKRKEEEKDWTIYLSFSLALVFALYLAIVIIFVSK